MQKIKGLLSILLIAAMLTAGASFAFSAGAGNEETYNGAILGLENWLETPGKPVEELQQIAVSFESLQNYEMSRQFEYYTIVLLKALTENFDFDYAFCISMLELDESFQTFLTDTLNSKTIRPVPELIYYVRGREAELNGDIVTAIGMYADSIDFYDAGERFENLATDVYARARKLMNNDDLVGAYHMFSKIKEYSDSAERMEYIARVLGTVPEHEHKWRDATCTEPKTCTVCGATEGAALGHEWRDATCTEPRKCIRCGATDGGALGHDWQDGSCTEPRKCVRCGMIEGEAPGHAWQDATCTEPRTCLRCGETEGAALGHAWQEANCTTPRTCTRCGATEGTAPGHEWKDASCTEPRTCSRCGTTEGGALGHAWQEANCTSPKTCTRCGATEGSALGHEWREGTCTEPRTCTRCGATDGTAPGHSWREATYVDPQTCTRCGATSGGVKVPPNCTKPLLGIVRIADGEQKAIRRHYDADSDILVWAYPGARYACYDQVEKKNGRTWYRIYVPEEEDWGWISSNVSTISSR